MCGICGIVAGGNPSPIDEHLLSKMRDVMTLRGPDDAGLFVSAGIGLGSRRLSILDLSKQGHMPMFSADGRYAIVYNGEVYNFRELRTGLEARGWQFHSHTDTEVLLALFIERGEEMLPLLNGMFAIAIWDMQEKNLFLARDRLGVKPIFYAVWQDKFYFASEIKSLLSAGIPCEFDSSCWGELLCFRYLAGEGTPYRHIKELLPGHYVITDGKRTQFKRWWNLSERILLRRHELPADPVDWFGQTFDSAVNLRRISDVPLGVLLSGGLDSSSLAASLACQSELNPDSFTVRFDDPGYDEGPLAREVADKWKLIAHEMIIPDDAIVPLLFDAVRLNDEPLAHGNEIHILAISRFAKKLVTVLLSGEGADEVLGGYIRYRPLLIASWLRLAAPILSGLDHVFSWKGRFHKLARFLRMGSIENFVLFNSCDVLPQELAAIGFDGSVNIEFRRKVLSEAQRLYPKEPVRQLMYLDQHTFLVSELDRIDRMTMGASIEARVPFLDYRLVEIAGAMSTPTHFHHFKGKQLLRKSFSERLPTSILRNPKWGFGAPWMRYFASTPELQEVVATLSSQTPIMDGPFDLKKIEQMASGYLQGDKSNALLVHQLTMISLWWRAQAAYMV